MQVLKQSVGVDISMDKYDVRFGVLTLSEDGRFLQELLKASSFKNTPEGHKKMLEWAMKQRLNEEIPISFIMEATGTYYESLAYFLAESKQKVAVIVPTKTKNFAKTLENKSKTDPLDSNMLATYGLEKDPECWRVPSEVMKSLKILTREYHTIKEMRTQIKNRLHALEHSHEPLEYITKLLKQQISFFDIQLKALEKKIRKLIEKDKDLNDRINKIDKIEGVGPMTIVSILAETDCFSLVFSMKQLASYAGLDVVHNESGLKKGKTSISKKGNRHLRNAVYMPALAAIRFNPAFKAMYMRLMEKGKPHKVVHVAVARKLLLLIYTIWKKNTEYIPDYHLLKAATSVA